MSPNKASNTHTHTYAHTRQNRLCKHTTKYSRQHAWQNRLSYTPMYAAFAHWYISAESYADSTSTHSQANSITSWKNFSVVNHDNRCLGQSCFRCWPNETLLCTTKVQPMCRGGGWEGMNTVYPHCSCRCRNFKTVTGLKYTRMRRFFILLWSTAFALKLTTGTAFYFIWEDTAFLFQHVLLSPCLGGKPVYTSYLPHQTLWGKPRWYGRQLCWKHSWNVWR